jgi:hypothetical protein
MTTDANDISRKDGLEALRAVFDTEKPRRGERRKQSVAIATTSSDPDLDKMNKKYAVVQVGGKVRVIFFEEDEDGRKLPVYQSIADFRAFHAKQRKSLSEARGGTREVGVGDWWIGHPDRRQFEAVVYTPNQSDPRRLNLWQGFQCDSERGNCSLYLKHVADNICAGNAEHFAYTMNWMAHCVQHPGTLANVAVVLKGKEGVGKGVFVHSLGQLFGAHYRQVFHGRHLTGNFNAHLQMCSLLFADEAFFAGDRVYESVLKALITEKTIQIEPKGLDLHSVRNCLHIIMASNSDWVVPAGADARRYFVLDVADTQKQNVEYFVAIEKQMKAGGLEALLHELLNRDLSNFEIRKVPQTEALAQQKQFSRRGVDQLIENLAQNGVLPNVHEKNPSIAITSGLEKGQGFWVSVRKLVPELKFRSPPVIANELKKWGCESWKDKSRRGMRFPPLPELRQKFDDQHGIQTWPDPSADWDGPDDTTHDATTATYDEQ